MMHDATKVMCLFILMLQVVQAQEQWIDVNRGLTNLNVTELVCDSEGTPFAATDGGGVFRSTRTVPVTVSEFLVE